LEKFESAIIMRIKVFALLALFVATLSMTGCDKGRAQMGPRETNLLGVAKIQKENYTPTGETTFAISTDELYNRRNFSGDKVTLLWGLVTLKDY
jgi:Rieske Fe-S protein